jgi:hypothetical protein
MDDGVTTEMKDYLVKKKKKTEMKDLLIIF